MSALFGCCEVDETSTLDSNLWRRRAEPTIRKCSTFTFPEISRIMEGFNRQQKCSDVILIDCSSIQTSAITSIECRSLAASFFESPIRAVFIADTAVAFGLARMIAGHSRNLNVFVCRSINAAYEICERLNS